MTMILSKLPVLVLFTVCLAAVNANAQPNPGPGRAVGGFCPEHGYWEGGANCPGSHSYGGSGRRNIGHDIGAGIYDFFAGIFSGPSPEERARRRAERLRRLDEKIAEARRELERKNREFRESIRSLREELRLETIKASNAAADAAIELFGIPEPVLAEGGPKAAFAIPASSGKQSKGPKRSAEVPPPAMPRTLPDGRIIRPWLGPRNPGEKLKNPLTDPELIAERASRDAELAQQDHALATLKSDSFQAVFFESLIDMVEGDQDSLGGKPVLRRQMDEARDRIVRREKAETLEAWNLRAPEMLAEIDKMHEKGYFREETDPAKQRESYAKFRKALYEARDRVILRYRKRVAESVNKSLKEMEEEAGRIQESSKPRD